MARTAIRDRHQRVIGYIDDQPHQQVGYDQSNRRKGRYDKRLDKTYDAQNREYGNGNLLTALILSP